MNDKYHIAFNTNYVSSLTGASISQLNSWDRDNIVSPSILKSEGRGSIRMYSFKDIVEIRTVKYLRDNQVPLKEIKRAIDYLRNSLNFDKPLSELVLIASNHNILCTPQGNINDITSQWLAAIKYGQLVMSFMVPLGAITKDLDEAITKYTKRIDEAEEEEKNGTLIPLSNIEEKLFGVSGSNNKKRGKRRPA